MTWLALVIDALACYRLTRLVVADGITEPIRDRIITKRDGSTREWWEQLLTCRWCVGVWVAFGVMVARTELTDVWSPVAYALAIACAAPLIALVEAED